MKILVTGSNGFIAKNLIVRLNEKNYNILEFKRGDSLELLEEKILESNLIFHLAGENRTDDDELFIKNNVILTKEICNILKNNNLKIPIIFSSSIHSEKHTAYGKSKKRPRIYFTIYTKKIIILF